MALYIVPRLEVLYVKLFDDCNVRCNMCDCWQQSFSRRDASFYIDNLDRLLALRPAAIRFTGGEPLLLHSLPDLVRHAATDARVSVITNGRLLRAKASALAEAGCAEVVVSLDGVGLTHDMIRGVPGLFRHCLEGLEAIQQSSMGYGINTVVQRAGFDDLPVLAKLLHDQPRPALWWHLIPVRDHDDLRPAPAQQELLRDLLPSMEAFLAEREIRLIGDLDMFDNRPPARCQVPAFTAYADADSGYLFGCNMLAHRDPAIGSYSERVTAAQVWSSAEADTLRSRCAQGGNAACGSCDPGSQRMNHLLRQLASERPG